MTSSPDLRTDDPHGLDVTVRPDRVPATVVVPPPSGSLGGPLPEGWPVVACQGVVSDAAADYARAKVAELFPVAGRRVLWARVKLSHTTNPADDNSSRAAVSFDVDGTVVRAHAALRTMPDAIDAAVHRLRTSLERLNDRHRDHHPHGSGKAAGATPRAPWYDRPPEDREVVRHKTFAPDRLSLDDALWDLELMDYDFFLFTEAGTGIDCVLERAVPDRAGPDGAVSGRAGPDPKGSEHLVAEPDGTEVVVHGLADRPEVAAALARPGLRFSHRPVPVLPTSGAIATLEAGGTPFELYENAFTGDRNVVYHRYDGHYGVITPPRDQPPSEERLVHEGH